MHTPALCRQPSARSRMLSSTSSARARRDLGDVVSGVFSGVSGVVHDASDVAHDVGHAVGDVISGQFSKVPADLFKTGIDLVNTGKDAVDALPSALKLFSGPDAASVGSASGDQTHGGGATQPTPSAVPGAGGGEGDTQTPSRSVSSQAPSSTTARPFSTSPSWEYTASAPSNSANSVAGAMNDESNALSGHPIAEPVMYPTAQTGAGWETSQLTNGMPLPSAASFTQSPTTMGGALPSNGSGSGTSAAHRQGFPLAAAAALGAVLGFLVVSLLFWAVWLYLRKRRRVYLPPRRMLSVTSGRTVSTVPLFISASEAGVKDENPFRHPRDADDDDPFDAASLWRSSTTRSASTLSV